MRLQAPGYFFGLSRQDLMLQLLIVLVSRRAPSGNRQMTCHDVTAGGGHRAHHAVGRCGAAGQHPGSQAAAGQIAAPTAGPHAVRLLRIYAGSAARPWCATWQYPCVSAFAVSAVCRQLFAALQHSLASYHQMLLWRPGQLQQIG